jgi:hypothetical protein
MINLIGSDFYATESHPFAMELTFTNADLARLCNTRRELADWAGADASTLEQLLNELNCARSLGRVEDFPYVRLLVAPKGRIGAHGADDAGVLLTPKLPASRSFRDAEAAVIVAVASGEEDFNPEGAAWPRAFATSQTMR